MITSACSSYAREHYHSLKAIGYGDVHKEDLHSLCEELTPVLERLELLSEVWSFNSSSWKTEYLLWMLPYFLWLFAFFFAPRLLKAWEFVLCSFFSSLIWFEWFLHWGFLVGTFFNFSCQLKAPRNQLPFLIQTNWQK